MQRVKTLFDELRIGTLSARNRFVRAATYEQASDAEGHVTPQVMQLYDGLARGGVGTIITSFAYVRDDAYRHRRMLTLCRDELVPEYRELAAVVHGAGSRIVAQLVYCGGNAGQPPYDEPAWAPSTGTSPRGDRPLRGMSRADMQAMADDFASSARRAKEAGFDGVELHAAHGYLLSQFLNPLWNHRTDEYGGGIENRVRFPLEVARRVRAEVGESFPILVKINSSDGVEGGMTEDESLVAATALAEIADGIEVSGTTYNRVKIAGPHGVHGLYASYAARLADRIDVPVILTGGNRRCGEMQELLDTTGIEGFGIARPLVCEPDLINTWEHDPTYEPYCVSCSRCFPEPGRNCVLHRADR